MKIPFPKVLTFNGGYVDTAGFLALHGLFAAHVTGNFATFGASLVNGTSGATGKLLALPVFCLVVMLARLAAGFFARRGASALKGLVCAMAVLLALGALLAIRNGPFVDGDSLAAIVTGVLLVAAMAIQNVVHRVHFPKAPPTTLMTGSTTQAMIDLADLAQGGLDAGARAAIKARCAALGTSICIFAAGCGVAALGYMQVGMWVFIPPVLLTTLLLLCPPSPEGAPA